MENMLKNLFSRDAWSTPRTLKGLIAASGLIALALALYTISGTHFIHGAVHTIGKETGPGVIAAQNIKSGLAQMDAEAANYLAGKPGQNMDSLRSYEKHRKETIDALTLAAEEMSFGEAEKVPILALQEGFGDYQATVAKALILHERGDAAFLAYYRHATKLLHETLFVEADRLDNANRNELNKMYDARHGGILARTIVTLLLGAALVAVLVFAQLYLKRKTNTTVNPYLAFATAVVFLFTVHTAWMFQRASHHLHVAKDEAFESLHTLSMARAIAFDVDGATSRWLLDKPRRSAYEAERANALKELFNSDWEQLVESATPGRVPNGIKGYFVDAARGTNFPFEKDAVVAMLKAFTAYLKVDSRVRELENQGQHEAAVKLCIGFEKGECNWAFNQFNDSILKTMEINQKAFDGAVESAFHDLDGIYLRAVLTALIATVMSVVGLGMRLRLYTAV